MTLRDLAALLPVLVLAGGSTALLLAGRWSPDRKRLMGLGVLVAIAAAAAPCLIESSVAEVGGMFGTGAYARFFAVLWSAVAALALLLSWRYAAEREFPGGEYTALILFAAAGMALLSSATSLVGLFLGLESYTIVLYILIAFDRRSLPGTEAGLKYLILGVVASGALAFGIALIYASSGTFHLPEAMAGIAQGARLRPLGLAGWGLLLLAAGFKVSLVPFHFWTPDVYQGAPAPIAGLLSAGSKGAVFSALVTLVAGLATWGELAPLLWVLAAATMLVGTAAALPQENLKRMLAYSSVAHMGYVLTALLAGGRQGNAAVIFYVMLYAAASLGAFGVIASSSTASGEPMHISEFRGAGFRHPFRSAVLTICLLALAGIPPTGGFTAKFGVFAAAIHGDYIGLAVVGILASLVSLYFYLRVIIVLYMSDEDAPPLPGEGLPEILALTLCILAVLALGVLPGPVMDWIATIL